MIVMISFFLDDDDDDDDEVSALATTASAIEAENTVGSQRKFQVIVPQTANLEPETLSTNPRPEELKTLQKTLGCRVA